MKSTRISLWAIPLVAILPSISAAQDKNWLVAPYLWGAGVSWDLASRGSGSVSASDLIDRLDTAAMIRVEYVRNKLGFTLDYLSMSLSDGVSISTPGPLPISIDVRAKLDQEILDVGTFYRPSASDSGVDYLVGIRDTDVKTTLRVTPSIGGMTQRFDSNPGFTDIYVGARYLHRVNDSWDVSIRGDYGFGDSDGSLNLLAGVGWRSSGSFGMHLLYRHFAFEFDQTIEGERATSDIDFSGPALGFMFRF